jgi:four helix bundle protein
MKHYSHKQLLVWQKSVELSRLIYSITESFPQAENYGITAQMRRAANSISANITEGKNRFSRKEFIRFLRIAYASATEVETWLILSKNSGYLTETDYDLLDSLLEELLKMLNRLISYLVKGVGK